MGALEHPSVEARTSPGISSGRRILVLTGDTRAGKTATCRRLAVAAAAWGWRTAGVICPARFQDGAKTGILAIDLRSGTTRLLAIPQRSSDPQTLGYCFDDETLAWANAAIASAAPTDLLIVDELGPLEILQGRGFLAAFELLRRGDYRVAVVVVRPSLLEPFAARLGLSFDLHTVEGVPYSHGDDGREPLAWFEEYLHG